MARQRPDIYTVKVLGIDVDLDDPAESWFELSQRAFRMRGDRVGQAIESLKAFPGTEVLRYALAAAQHGFGNEYRVLEAKYRERELHRQWLATLPKSAVDNLRVLEAEHYRFWGNARSVPLRAAGVTPRQVAWWAETLIEMGFKYPTRITRPIRSSYYGLGNGWDPDGLLEASKTQFGKLPPKAAARVWRHGPKLFRNLSPGEVRWGNHKDLLPVARALAARRAAGTPRIGILRKVGRMSPIARLVAGQIPYQEELPPEAAERLFWGELREGLKNTLLFAWSVALSKPSNSRLSGPFKELVSRLAGVPFGDLKGPNAHLYLLPVPWSGKAAKKAWLGADWDRRAFAVCIAKENQDIAQRVLGLETIIPSWPSAQRLLSRVPVPTALRLVQQTTFTHRGEERLMPEFVVDDIFRMVTTCEAKGWSTRHIRIRDWYGWHEDLVKVIINNQEDQELRVDPRIEPLDGVCGAQGEWELRVPKSAVELVLWGKEMDNCIGGYTNAINRGDSLILGVFEGCAVKYGIEISPDMTLKQFYGHGNRDPEPTLAQQVKATLKQAGVKCR